MSDFDFEEVPSSTPDFKTEAARQLAELFPEAVEDGKVNFDALQTVLGDDLVSGGREKDRKIWSLLAR